MGAKGEHRNRDDAFLWRFMRRTGQIMRMSGMNHRTLRLLAPLPLLLAAAPSPPLMPGLWEETLVFALDRVNGSEDAAARLRGALPSPTPNRNCYDAADLADPRAIFLAGAEQSCRFSRFNMAGGAIDAAGDCSDGHGQTMHVDGKGSYNASGYDFGFKGTGEANGLALEFRGRDSGRRIAACPAPSKPNA